MGRCRRPREAGGTHRGRPVPGRLRFIAPDYDPVFFASDGQARLAAAVATGDLPEQRNAADERIGAPVARPGKVVCIDLNYYDHTRETNAEIPAEPVVFMKASSSVVGQNDEVLVPRRTSTKTNCEVEARYLPGPAAAAGVIAGYTISNDVSEREFQLERGGQWDKGKSCETFNPMGPWLLSSEEVPDPQQLGLRLWVNGSGSRTARPPRWPSGYIISCGTSASSWCSIRATW